MKKIYRYPGAKPFETSENHIFYGRKEDAEELYQRIRLNPLVLLHAKSGMGKSSLINAGLIPLMQQEGQFSMTSVRFNACTAPTDQKPLENTRLAISSQSDLLDKIRPEGDNSLWYQLKSQQINQPKGQRQLLIFDQFEELFTYDETAIRQFASELSEALYSSLPQRFREQRKAGFAKNPDFLSPAALAQLAEPIDLHILLAIRSDRMSLLKKVEVYLPNILSKDFELQALSSTQAEDAILSPAYQKQSKGFNTPIFDYTDEAIEYLLDFLSEKGTQPIESFQLQILCEFVESILVEQKGKILIKQSDIANPDQILENYYLDKIKEINNPEEQLAARKLIEEGLIFEEEERRLTLYEGQIVNTYHVSPDLLNKLLDTHLIRSEPSLRGGYTYELSHDTLVTPVLKAKTKRLEKERIAHEAAEKERRSTELKMAQEKAEAEMKLREKAEEAVEMAKKSERKAKQRLLMARIGMAIAFAFLVFAYFQFENAKAQTKLAKDNLEQLQQEQTKKEAAEKAKAQEQLRRIKQEAETFMKAEEYWFACQKWEEAYQLDSTDTVIIKGLEKCE